MLALVYAGSQWDRVSTKSCEAKRAFHHNSWKTHLARIQARGGPQLRDFSMLLNRCIDSHAYHYCTKTYKAKVHTALGADPDLALVARQPLFTLLNAPNLNSDSSPLFADRAINQAYIIPEWFHCERKARRLLICTTSRTHTLSMPLQVFQAYALQHFDGIAYLFDVHRNHYQDCLENTINCVQQLVKSLEPGSISFLGTSSGACMAMHLRNEHAQAKVIAGSPVLDVFPELASYLKTAPVEDLYRYLRITYGNNAIDNHYRHYFERLSCESSLCVAINMSHISPTHASLGVTTLNGTFKRLLGWLASTTDGDLKPI